MASDSVDKIVDAYFSAITSETFTYKGKTYAPKPLRISEGIFRGFTCPAECGGCCFNVTLDFVPGDQPHADLVLQDRTIEFNGKQITIKSFVQPGNQDRYCSYLRKADGRCKVHGGHPMPCDFELLKFISHRAPHSPNHFNTRLHGRGWGYKRVDGQVGALCKLTPPSEETVADAVRKLNRLKLWVDYFGLRTCLDGILEYVRTGPHPGPVYLNTEFTVPKRTSLTLLEPQ